MASGKPDWYLSTVISGAYDSTIKALKVDADGQLYTLFIGQSIEISDIINVTDKTRDIRGLDGSTLRLIGVDASGYLICRIKGSFGGVLKDLAVDTDGYIQARIMGWDGAARRDIRVDSSGYMLAQILGLDGTTLRNIAVDSSGKMIALMQGVYDSVLKTVAVDNNGIMKANLSAQSLEWLTVRPAYGTIVRSHKLDDPLAAGGWGLAASMSGQGVILGGFLALAGDAGLWASSGRINFDNVDCDTMTLAQMKQFNVVKPLLGLMYMLKYDVVSKYFALGLTPGMTFEGNCHVYMKNPTAAEVLFSYDVLYAMVP